MKMSILLIMDTFIVSYNRLGTTSSYYPLGGQGRTLTKAQRSFDVVATVRHRGCAE